MSYQLDEVVEVEDTELLHVLTRIADSLDRIFVGTVACSALLVLIAVCEVLRLGVFG